MQFSDGLSYQPEEVLKWEDKGPLEKPRASQISSPVAEHVDLVSGTNNIGWERGKKIDEERGERNNHPTHSLPPPDVSPSSSQFFSVGGGRGGKNRNWETDRYLTGQFRVFFFNIVVY